MLGEKLKLKKIADGTRVTGTVIDLRMTGDELFADVEIEENGFLTQVAVPLALITPVEPEN